MAIKMTLTWNVMKRVMTCKCLNVISVKRGRKIIRELHLIEKDQKERDEEGIVTVKA